MPDDNVQVQREVEDRTGIRPCIWQIEVVCKVLEGVDVITISLDLSHYRGILASL